MKRIVLCDVLVLLVCLLGQSWTGSALSLDIAPRDVNGLVHNEVHLRCKLDNSDVDVKEIMLLEVTKAGVTVALHRQSSKTNIAAGMTSKFQAEGNISTSAYDSYIDVTLTNPEVVDSGSYTCQMFYLDRANVLKQAITSGNLTVSDNDVKAAIRHLVDLESNQKERVGQLEKELEDQKNAQEAKEAELQDRISNLTYKVAGQKMQLVQQAQSLKDLKDKENEVVYFSALHNKTGPFTKGNVIAFGDVVANVGGGYNGHTGVFTAPVSGLYVFHVALNAHAGHWMLLDLRSSDGKVLARLLSGDTTYNSEASTSCVARLETGMRVTPIVYEANAGFYLVSYSSPGYINKLYGYLSKPL